MSTTGKETEEAIAILIASEMTGSMDTFEVEHIDNEYTYLVSGIYSKSGYETGDWYEDTSSFVVTECCIDIKGVTVMDDEGDVDVELDTFYIEQRVYEMVA